MNDLLLLATVVATFSIVQSLFGVGLLVFGTPTLLLLGYPFEMALATLLPASLALSLVQTLEGRSRCVVRAAFFAWSVPAIAIGLAVVLTGVVRPRMGAVVGALLIATAAIRLSSRVRAGLERAIGRHFGLCAAVTGLVHGLSNLGGGPLTIIMSTLHQDRDAIRTNVACAYFVFSSIQLAVLAMLTPAVLSPGLVVFPIVSLSIYVLVGHGMFRRTTDPVYNRLLTAFTFAFGAALVARELLS